MSSALQAVKQFRIRELAPLLRAEPKLSNTNAAFKARNPFLPYKNPDSGRWAPPKYSLRRQAELVKHARASGMLHLLPPGPKLTPKELAALPRGTPVAGAAAAAADGAASSPTAMEADAETVAAQGKWWTGEVEWEGEYKAKEVKGADVGNRLYASRKRMFKGHKWERTFEKREWERKMLMKDMKGRVERFRTTYKRKTPNPVSPARPVSYSKLPF